MDLSTTGEAAISRSPRAGEIQDNGFRNRPESLAAQGKTHAIGVTQKSGQAGLWRNEAETQTPKIKSLRHALAMMRVAIPHGVS
ncbi:hypothetical protein AB4Z48_16760 [Cupriavidus sp. 2TAF22]|uniref:hypothetical protein n=1 Tax=unclassified Cupriavidus TaxID=2640874 RepID=UPI003F8DEBF8